MCFASTLLTPCLIFRKRPRADALFFCVTRPPTCVGAIRRRHGGCIGRVLGENQKTPHRVDGRGGGCTQFGFVAASSEPLLPHQSGAPSGLQQGAWQPTAPVAPPMAGLSTPACRHAAVSTRTGSLAGRALGAADRIFIPAPKKISDRLPRLRFRPTTRYAWRQQCACGVACWKGQPCQHG